LYPLKTLEREILTYVVKQFFYLPPESLSTQKGGSLDQGSKEVPRGKIGRLVEAIDLGIRNWREEH
jgi:hypothetical protein